MMLYFPPTGDGMGVNHLILCTYAMVIVNMLWFKWGHGLEVTQDRVYVCTITRTSAREESLVVDGRKMLGTSKRMVEIFAHIEDQKYYLYWRGMTRDAMEKDNDER